MHTLVTGATGIVGNSIARALVDSGRSVRALVRSIEKAKRVLPASVELVQGDITDPAAVDRAVAGCSIVHHSAGLPEQWLRDTSEFERVHVGGAQRVLDAVRAHGVSKLVYTSTIDVFEGRSGEDFDESKIDPQPKGTVYEVSKQNADLIVAAAVEKLGVPAVFIHPAALYGPAPAASPGLNDFIVRLREKKAPVLVPGGMPVVYAPDVARGHLLAEKAAPGSRYILSERFRTMRELAAIITRELGLNKVPPVMPLGIAKLVAASGELISNLFGVAPLLPKGQLHFLQWGARPRSDRAQRELGWVPTPFEEGLRKTIEYLRTQKI